MGILQHVAKCNKTKPLPTQIDLNFLIEKKIYYLCYSNKSKTTIKGYDPDDLAQELRIHMNKKLHMIDGTKNPEGYIATAMKMKLIDIWRKVNRSKDALDHYEIVPLLPNDEAID